MRRVLFLLELRLVKAKRGIEIQTRPLGSFVLLTPETYQLVKGRTYQEDELPLEDMKFQNGESTQVVRCWQGLEGAWLQDLIEIQRASLGSVLHAGDVTIGDDHPHSIHTRRAQKLSGKFDMSDLSVYP